MLKVFRAGDSILTAVAGVAEIVCQQADGAADPIWIDASGISREEELALEKALALDLDPQADLSHLPIEQPLQVSARQMTMTALLPVGLAELRPTLSRVVMLRSNGPLVTLTFGEGDPFAHLLAKYPQEFVAAKTPGDIVATILRVCVDDIADGLDGVSEGIDRMNRTLFQHHATKARRSRLDAAPRLRNRQIECVLQDLGAVREILVKNRRSILSLRRLVAALRERKDEAFNTRRLETLERELVAIADAEVELSATAGFLLDGAVGFIDIQQNKVVSILAVVSVVLTPPIWVASIYGMNFKGMPELEWRYGYVYALALMALSGIAMYGLARRRGWL